jgi:5-amino-6-(5-phosphoribosylamino)uracil reductase
MSADGKIADEPRSPARFGSDQDRYHLETQVAAADAMLLGAGTLRAYGTSLVVRRELLAQRRQRGQPDQPVHIVVSASGRLNPKDRFFSQPLPRWLMTTTQTATRLGDRPEFDRILTAGEAVLDLPQAIAQLPSLGIHTLVVGGGGQLVASLVAAGWVDDLWLTICPLLLGGQQAPTPLDGIGYPQAIAPRLELCSADAIAQEVFLHYRVVPISSATGPGSPSPGGPSDSIATGRSATPPQ